MSKVVYLLLSFFEAMLLLVVLCAVAGAKLNFVLMFFLSGVTVEDTRLYK
jgi:hypothetical protein